MSECPQPPTRTRNDAIGSPVSRPNWPDIVHLGIGASAAAARDRVAIEWQRPPGNDWTHQTYGELWSRSGELSAALRGSGVVPGDVVGVSVERCGGLIVALLGILRSGAAYLPLDPDLPPDRRAYMLDDASPRAVVIQEGREGPATADGSRNGPEEGKEIPAIVRIRADGRVVTGSGISDSDGIHPGHGLRTGHRTHRVEIPDAPAREPSEEVTPGERAYILYTSGSTGRPKGVELEHRAVMNRLRWAQDTFHLDEGDVVLQKTPISFDVSVWELFWPLLAGARLVLARPGGHRDPEYLAEVIEDRGVTVMHFVPSMLRPFLDLDDLNVRCGTLRHVLCSGEALPYPLTCRFYERMPGGVELHNLYGPTEAAIDVSHWPVPREADGDEVVPIGRPVANTTLHVLDESMEPCGIGEPGELWIGGVQLARGYLNRPDLTAERFVENPIEGSSDGRLYRTGDRVQWREDGTLEFLGRLDRQVKVRGHRVELGEVEAALIRLPSVAEAAVVFQDDDPASEGRLVAYVVSGDGASMAIPELRRLLGKELPEAMIPSVFIEMEAMPLTHSGKLDRGSLPRPDGARPDLGGTIERPRTPLERFVAGIWADELGVREVGVHDRFFELGGSSLAAARAVSRIAERLGEHIYVVTLFDAPTVSEYAKLLGREYEPAVRRMLGETESGPLFLRDGDMSRFSGNGATGNGAASTAESTVESTAESTTESTMDAATRRERTPRDGVDADTVVRFERCIPRFLAPREPRKAGPERETPAPSPLFILAPPRSGTTLLRVMLQGNPGIFAAPELNLLNFESLGQRRDAFTGRHSAWKEGVIRTFMEIHECGPDEARSRMDELEGSDLPTVDLYALLQEWVGDRILADKTPAYALDPMTLERAEEDFDAPLYIHLVRHPADGIQSFLRQHMDQILFLKDHDFTPSQLAELVWLVSHRNVVEFLHGVSPRRWIRIRFEDMVRRPVRVMQRLSRKLGIPYDRAMVRPYESVGEKMVDGTHPESTPMGDQRFLEKRSIDPSVAYRHARDATWESMSPRIWHLARILGYRSPGEPPRQAESGGWNGAGAEIGWPDDAGRARDLRLDELRRREGAYR